MNCKICQGPSVILARAKILDKYWSNFSECQNCGYIFSDEPTWLEEAYSEAINTSDLGLVDRNFRISYSLLPLLKLSFPQSARFVDYGGGYGLLVRVMRDRGYDFYRCDHYCENLFAKGFEAEVPNTEEKYDLLTAVEVFEHLVDPVQEVKKMLQYSNNILFTTEVIKKEAFDPKPGLWSYFGLEHGQHVSFFTEKSLNLLAQTMGLFYSTNSNGLHLFSKKAFSVNTFRLLTSYRIGKYFGSLFKRDSLLSSDYRIVTGHEL